MAALDGKNTIGKELRPCIVYIPEISYKSWDNKKQKMKYVSKRKEDTQKALFHCWHPVTGNAIVEYEDGTIHMVELKQIQFVDNVIGEYAFPEVEDIDV